MNVETIELKEFMKQKLVQGITNIAKPCKSLIKKGKKYSIF